MYIYLCCFNIFCFHFFISPLHRGADSDLGVLGWCMDESKDTWLSELFTTFSFAACFSGKTRLELSDTEVYEP